MDVSLTQALDSRREIARRRGPLLGKAACLGGCFHSGQLASLMAGEASSNG